MKQYSFVYDRSLPKLRYLFTRTINKTSHHSKEQVGQGRRLSDVRWSSCLATMRLLASAITPHPCDEPSVLLGRIKPAHRGPLQPQQNCPVKIQFIPQNTEGEEWEPGRPQAQGSQEEPDFARTTRLRRPGPTPRHVKPPGCVAGLWQRQILI